MPVDTYGLDTTKAGDSTIDLVAELGGWKALRETLRAFDEGAERTMVRAIQSTADKVVGDARGKASPWARTGAFMRSIGRREVNRLLAEQVADGKPEELEISCRFCNTHYVYSKDELEKMDFAK